MMMMMMYDDYDEEGWITQKHDYSFNFLMKINTNI